MAILKTLERTLYGDALVVQSEGPSDERRLPSHRRDHHRSRGHQTALAKAGGEDTPHARRGRARKPARIWMRVEIVAEHNLPPGRDASKCLDMTRRSCA